MANNPRVILNTISGNKTSSSHDVWYESKDEREKQQEKAHMPCKKSLPS